MPISFTDFSTVDYNSWQESEKGLRLAASLDKNVVLAEGMNTFHGKRMYSNIYYYAVGYKEYNTARKYLVTMGDWRKNKDDEVDLDGVGGVNILVKADVHRSG